MYYDFVDFTTNWKFFQKPAKQKTRLFTRANIAHYNFEHKIRSKPHKPILALWEKKSIGSESPKIFSIFGFRFSIFDFRFSIFDFRFCRSESIFDFRFSTFDFRFSISVFRLCRSESIFDFYVLIFFTKTKNLSNSSLSEIYTLTSGVNKHSYSSFSRLFTETR